MPYPQNLETARAVEAAVRERGAEPATIAVWGGVPRIGLEDAELEALANTPGVWKLSRRDLPFAVAQKLNGATTVASTMILAAKAGIRVFATGGIGGVHRGAERTFDISADLTELARTPVAVVSAGAKAILDLGLTLEYLETQGVPVIGYRTDEFPAFYTPRSGHRLELRADSPQELAAVLRAKWDLGLEGGVLIANPIPEADALPADEMETAIAAAVREAEASGIEGKALTPFLLSKIKQLTAGRSLEANIRLVLHNAALAAEVAKALLSA
jgi:pseudouridine-5'-phosphate glycosidase